MKHTQFVDAFRSVKKQKVSWFAVVVISMLSVLAYLGINFASRGLAGNGNSFYDSTAFRDAEIVSTLLVTPDDLKEIAATDGVCDVEGVYYTTGKAVNGEAQVGVDIVSLTERINVPLLLEGRLPENAGECALEKPMAEELGIAPGDRISVTGEHGGNADYLVDGDFTVVGLVYHPDHAAVPMSMPGNRDVIVLPAAFDAAALDGCYMKAVALFGETKGADRFSDGYKTAAAKVLEKLEELSVSRAAARDADLNARYGAGIDKARAELADGQKKLEAARAELDSGWAAYYEGEKQLEEAASKIESGEKELAEAEKQLAEAKKRLEEGEAEYAANARLLAEAKKQLEEGEAEYVAYGERIKSGEEELEAAEKELAEGKAGLDEAESRLIDGRAKLAEGYAEIRGGINDLIESVNYAMADALGEYAALLRLGKLDTEVDPDDPDASAGRIAIAGDIEIDLSRSLSDNLFSLVSSAGVPEDVLREAAAKAGTVISAAADRAEVVREFTDTVIAYYELADFVYDSIAEAAGEWDAGHEEYIAGRAEYAAGLEEYAAGAEKYEKGRAEYEKGLEEYAAARKTLDAGREQYERGAAELAKGKAELDSGRAEYEKGLADYLTGREDYERGLADREAGMRELEDSRRRLESGEEEYKNGADEYAAGVKELEDAEEKLADMGNCRWVVLGAGGNAGYVSINHGVGNIADMGITFALVFVLVGAIMIYATSGRIVEEQRRLIGATKALGLYTREIFAKYLAFGVSATALGMLLGVAAGYFALQRLLLYIYGRYYVFGPGRSAFLPGMTAVVFIAGLLLSAFAVWSSCSHLLRSTATSLMQEKTPDAKRRKAGSSGSGKSLYSKLIIRNMLSDKKRLLVTVVSIAGCCVLLTAGFTMRSSVMKALASQFDDIAVYDAQIVLDPEQGENAFGEVAAMLDENGADALPVYTINTSFSTEGRLMACTVICGDIQRLNGFYKRPDVKSGEPITAEGDGVWLNQRAAETYGIAAGDGITLFDGRMNPYSARVAGIFRTYAGRDVIISETQYAAIYGAEPEYNGYLVNISGADAEAIKEGALAIGGVASFTDMRETRALIMDQAAVMNLLAVVMIVIAGLMAYFILLNLTSMYIQQKKRELTIMRINGFTVREVINYVLREMIVTTALGVAIGLGLGSLLGEKVVSLMESVTAGFIHGIQWEAWLFAALITLIYSVAINAFVLRKVKYLKLNDVA